MKRVLCCIALCALLFALGGCAHQATTAGDMEADEFLRQVAKPARRASQSASMGAPAVA